MRRPRATKGSRGLTDVLRQLIDSKPESGVVQRRHFIAMLKEVSGREMKPLYVDLVEKDAAIDLAKFLAGTGFRVDPATRNIAIALDTDREKMFFETLLSE